ncbi:uncharacterized protein JCM10292_001759 [Rhodotorula paludigena]|uniref:uncharacterized protein n=1 Tax=Rhodotorula paludigena TaxID=86838 RepID=UPI00317805F7
MGRNTPKKASPAPRSLSSRLGLAATPAAPSPLRVESTPAATSRSASTSRTASPASTSAATAMPAQKRAFDDDAGPSTPAAGAAAAAAKKAKRRPRRKGKGPALALNGTPGGKDDDEDALEEGEVVEGDFSDLFVVDTTPAAVKDKDRFQPTEAQPSPLKAGAAPALAEEEDSATLPLAVSEGKELAADTDDAPVDDAAMDSDDVMRAFAQEVSLTDDGSEDDDDGSSSSDDEDGLSEGLMLYDNEDDLKKAIQGRIVDDSSAPVTGRYYKEADLTKTCVLCGEPGHTSRDCTHSQCFICGAIDSDHEARNCPVALICVSCGSRGHFARECTVNPNSRGSFSQRCTICQSGNHMTPNCPSQWRIYDTTGPKPPKRKLQLSCANCGSNKDHFIDDCLLPRGHPMKYADPSAFNRAALGPAYASSLPAYSAAGPSGDMGRRKGGPTGKLDRRPLAAAYGADDDDGGGSAADDDWFASRARTQASRGGGGRSGGRGGGGGGGGGGGRGTHIHFSDDSRSRFDRGGGASGGYRDRDREYSGSGYDSPRDDWRSMCGGGGDGGRRGGKGHSAGGRGPPPSLLDRVGGSGGGRQPRYRGGYV